MKLLKHQPFSSVAAVAGLVGRYRCVALTAAVLAFLAASAVFGETSEAEKLVRFVFYITVILAPYFVSRSRKVGKITLVAGVFVAAPNLFVICNHTTNAFSANSFELAVWGLVLGFEILLTMCVIRYSVSSADAREPIGGVVLTYLLIGIVFSNIYFLISQYAPGAFACNGETFAPTMNDLRYFSYVTLTTCGFGDITPVNRLARTVAAMESVTGVLYVGIFIGKLVSRRRTAGGTVRG